jgi:hypothetical protein
MNAQTKIEAAAHPLVYRRIAAVQGALAKVGIAKNRRNSQGSGYNFRGIDDVYAALSPLLAEHGLVIIPRMTERVTVERQSKAGGALFNVTVKADFDFVAEDDGSIHTATTYGEAMDSGDKATNKAMSAAYKYAAFMTFAIPTEGDNDADETTHDVAADPARPLSDANWAMIVQLVQATKTPSDEVKAHIGAANLKLATPDQYAKAVSYLKDKLAAMAKSESNAAAKSGFGEILDDEIPY